MEFWQETGRETKKRLLPVEDNPLYKQSGYDLCKTGINPSSKSRTNLKLGDKGAEIEQINSM